MVPVRTDREWRDRGCVIDAREGVPRAHRISGKDRRAAPLGMLAVGLGQGLQQRFDVPLYSHVVLGEFDQTVGSDGEGRADHADVDLAVQLLLAICAVPLVHGQIGVRQEREGEMVAFVERAQLADRILGNAEHLVSDRGETSEIVAKVTGFGGASWRHCGRVEVQEHSSALTGEFGQRDRGVAAIRIDGWQREVGRGLAGREPGGEGRGESCGCG